jgi:aminoglycoside phosphotransferase (APT) family kinase protein
MHDPLLETLHIILAQTFGPQVRLESHRILNQHPGYWVLFAHLERPDLDVSIKLADPASPMSTDFDRTVLLQQMIQGSTTIPVADILGVDTTCQTVSYRYLIRAYLPGQEWATVYPVLDESQRIDAFRQLGRAVAEIHAVRFDQFGEITSSSQTTPLTYLEALASRAETRIASPRLRDLMLSVIEARKDLFTDIQVPRLCHDDLHHYNVLFKPEGDRWLLATILDFEKAWAADAQSDLARLDLWTHMMHPAFREVYEAVHPIDALYSERRPVYQLLWCLEYAQSTPEHLQTTQAICHELGIPVLDSFEDHHT